MTIPRPASRYGGTPLDTLKATRKFLADRKRWSQGKYQDVRKRWFRHTELTYCLAGAMAFVKTGDAYRFLAISEEARLVGEAIGLNTPNVDYLVVWNDKSTRKHSEVLAALDKAIALAEERS